MSFNHGGDIRSLTKSSGLRVGEILDFSASLNPLGFPDWLRQTISASVSSLANYPDPFCVELVEAFAESRGIPPAQVIAGNGSTELLFLAPAVTGCAKALIPEPSYIDYRQSAERAGLVVESFPLLADTGFNLDVNRLEERIKGGELVYIGNPNNPTGKTVESTVIREMAERNIDTTFVVDESFAGFIKDFDSITDKRPPNVIVIISLTKLFATPGLRLGLAVAEKSLIEKFRGHLPPWSVNSLAQVFGTRAIKDYTYVQETTAKVTVWRNSLVEDIDRISGLRIFDSQVNYLLLRIERSGIDANHLATALLEKRIAIRTCGNFAGLDEKYFRVAVRTPAENKLLVAALIEAMHGKIIKKSRTKTPAIMFQGVSSDSGKSVMTAALCRVLYQDGYDVAPFKSQNMALNSYVTLDGNEIGRAQATQAQACRLEPSALMNPILLKPTNDTGAQVVILGKTAGSMNVAEYFAFKKEKGFAIVKTAFDTLADKHEIIVMEGAGSPAEVNLKASDIVNMRMARHAGARAILVGDIDRGGVFASFIGCVETMAEWERSILSGFLINKFRGDQSLLDSAIEYTGRHCGIPTLGVVPYMKQINMPEEDRTSLRHGFTTATENDSVTIAVVRLARTSNFTDFDSLSFEPEVKLVSAETADDLNHADAVVLPGSKNVIGDLMELERTGMAKKITELAGSKSAMIIGLCGGFQMLGKRINDPHGIESEDRSTPGLGLLDTETTLMPEKALVRMQGKHLESGMTIGGYEIHHGETTIGNCVPAVVRDDGMTVGVSSPDGSTWGAYPHGLFDQDEFRRWFIDKLRERKGLAPKGVIVTRYDMDGALDRLADTFRASVDMKMIYQLLGL